MAGTTTVCIYKVKKSGIWYMKWRDARRRQHKRTTNTRDKVIARNLAKELERTLVLSPLGLAPAPIDTARLWSQAVEDFCSMQLRLRKTTVDSYRRCAKAFQKAMGDIPFVDATELTLDKYVKVRLENGIKAATVNKELRHFRAILGWSLDRRYIHAKPSFKKLFVREDQRDPVRVPGSTFKLLLKTLANPKLKLDRRSPKWWEIFIRLLHGTACRLNEVLELRWPYVDFDAKTITVLAETSKGRKDKTIPLGATLTKELRIWKAIQKHSGSDDRVVPWIGGKRQLYEEYEVIEKMAKVPHFRFKDYRSSRACALAADGESLLVIKEFLGHSSAVTTEKFYANARDRLAVAAARMEEREFGTPPGTTEKPPTCKTP